jgi:hypothetical protein
MRKFTNWKSWPRNKHLIWVHPSLYTSVSTIPDAGTGVFTTTDIPKGAHLGYYTGRIHWSYPDHDDRNFDYMMGISYRPGWIGVVEWRRNRQNRESPTVDGDSLLGYINCCLGDCQTQNCMFTGSGRFVTTRGIPAGRELFIHYGPEYWDVHNAQDE